jgi:hypothetical protein
MKRFTAFVLPVVFLLIAAANTGCIGDQKIRQAKTRVNAVLRGITQHEDQGPAVGDEETALCRWWRDKARLFDRDELDEASNAFDEWRKEMNIYPYINEYTIDHAVMDGNDVIVFVTIDGLGLAMRVPEKDRISWTDYTYEDEEEEENDDNDE